MSHKSLIIGGRGPREGGSLVLWMPLRSNKLIGGR